MAYQLRLRAIARRDAESAQAWYYDVSPSLGSDFTEELLATLHFLAENPEIGSLRYAHFLPDRSLRTWSLDRFPFLIFYRREDDFLDVLRILHERRDVSADLITH